MNDPQRILVIKSRHIGDVLLTGPLLTALKRGHPTAQVSLLVKKECATLMEGHPDVAEVLTFPERIKEDGTFARLWRMALWVIRLRQRRFDWVINTTEGDRGIIAAFLSGAERRSSLWRPGGKAWRRWLLTEVISNRPGRRHTVLRNVDLLGGESEQEPHAVRLLATYPDWLQVEQRLLEQGWDRLRPLVQVHPPSRWLFKCWTVAGMAGVIDHLADCGCQVVLTSGPSEVEQQRNQAIIDLCRQKPINVSGLLNLPQTAALTAHCILFFGVDTAPAHMAAALNVPVVVLFGPSGAFDWGPWPNGWQGGATPYPAQNGIQSAGPHWVIQKEWPCAPCGRDGCEGSKKSRCLDEMSLQEVIAVLQRVPALASLVGAANRQEEPPAP
ncbi:MAG: putative lipopolysaccharide heptosyltransferase III [Magnetococcales bacterium]|nr:putative lipopolysaccharide heptosyltransferase III [Magnetococcales bacterium]